MANHPYSPKSLCTYWALSFLCFCSPIFSQNTVSIQNLANSYCDKAVAVSLVGQPAGGVFTIDGLAATVFDPSLQSVGNHTVVYSFADKDGQLLSATQNVSVLPIPNVYIDIRPDTNLFISCTNKNVIVKAQPDGIVPIAGFLWNTTENNQSITVYNKGIYAVTVTANNGCTVQKSIEVTQNTDLPVVTLNSVSGNTHLTCQVTTIVLEAMAQSSQFSWYKDGVMMQPPVTATSIFATTKGLYTVKAQSDINTCTNEASITITEAEKPVVNIQGLPPTLCQNAPTTAIVGVPAGGSFIIDNNPAYSLNSLTQYVGNHTVVYSYTNASGCSGTATQTVNVLPIPNVFIDIRPDTNLFISCTNKNVIVKAQPDGVVPVSGFLWNTNDINQFITVYDKGIYTVTVTANNGCTVQKSIEVTQNITPPALTVSSVSGNTQLSCQITTIVLEAMAQSSQFSWYKDGLLIQPPVTTTSIFATTKGRYTVRAISDINTCTNEASIDITENLADKIPILSACPTNITVNAACGATKAAATWIAPTATASCGTTPPSVSSNFNTGFEFPIGTTNVIYTATLGSQTTSCSFTVTVNAAAAATPILSACPANITVNAACGATKAAATWIAPTATASCGTTPPSVSSNFNTGFAFPIGTTNVIYTATLGSQTKTCSFSVTVNPSGALLPPSVPPSHIIQPTCVTPTGAIRAISQTGVVYSFDNGMTYQTSNIKSDLVAGTYLIKVKNAAGCISTATSVTLTPATSVNATIGTNIAAAYCQSKDLDKLSVQGLPVGGIFRLDGQNLPTQNGSTVLKLENLAVGAHVLNYTVSQNGCSSTATKQFAISASPVPPSVNLTQPTCNTSGSITITNLPAGASTRLNNGVWTVGKTVYTGLLASEYKVFIRQNECESSREVELEGGQFDFDPKKCYKIVNRHSGKVLDVAANGMLNYSAVIQYSLNGANGTANQKWRFDKASNGFVKVMAQHSQKFLTCYQNIEEANVYQYDYFKTSHNDWAIECSGSYFRFKHRFSGRYLSIEGNNPIALSSNNANVEIRTWANQPNQEWSIVEVPCGNTTNLAQKTVLTAGIAAEPTRIRLNWYSNLGKEADFYQIEKWQELTQQFEKLSALNNPHADETVHTFTYFDNQPQEGENLYRIGAFLKNGTQKWMENLTVKFGRVDNLQVYPNPASDEIWLNLKAFEGRKAVVRLNDVLGNILLTNAIDMIQKTPFRLETTQLSNGVYTVFVEIEGKKAQIQKVVIQR
jgi:Ricin-type beta-trefoil lectin domain-like/Secretion system C-terminal sorting domain/HYR domain